MPTMQVMLTTLNQRFGPEAIRELSGELFAEGARLADAARELGVGGNGIAEFLDRWPAGLQAGLSAVLRSAVARGMPVTFAWAPGYDFEMTVWDVADTEQTYGGVTILLKSRYPDDRHPLGL